MHTFQDPGVREREWDRILEHIRESQEKRISCIPRENFKNCKESEKNPRKASEASQKNLSNGKDPGKTKSIGLTNGAEMIFAERFNDDGDRLGAESVRNGRHQFR